MQRLNRVAIAISLSTFVLTGCGGGSDDTAATTTPAAPAAPAARPSASGAPAGWI